MPEMLVSLLISGCLGALIGLARQWSEQREGQEDAEFAGLRTFTFFSLLGYLAAYGTEQVSPWLLPALMVVVGGYFAAVAFRAAVAHPVGYSTFAASLIAILVGCLVQWQQRQAAVMIVVITAGLLAFKQTVHAWTRRFTTEDMRSALQFAAVTGVILPLVPDHGYGPYQALNPYSIWLMVVLISGLGFVGYLLMRLLGTEAGITITGLAGGMASSTATTLAFSRRSVETPTLSLPFAMAVVLACTVMLYRIAALVAVLNRTLFATLLVPLLVMSIPGLAYAAWVWLSRRAHGQTVSTVQLANPLNLTMAIKFALLYGLINLLVKAAAGVGQPSSLLLIGAISGLTDMDAIALSMADSVSKQTVTADIGAQVILVAALSNTMVKAGLALALGSPQLRRAIAVVLGLTLLFGAAAIAVTR